MGLTRRTGRSTSTTGKSAGPSRSRSKPRKTISDEYTKEFAEAGLPLEFEPHQLPLEVLTIRIEDFHSSMAHMGEAMAEQETRIKTGLPVTPTMVLSYESLDELRKFLTPQRQVVYQTLRRTDVDSVYTLAKMLDREYKAVAEDLKVLDDIGLITFKREIHNGRARSKPVLTHKKLVIEFA